MTVSSDEDLAGLKQIGRIVADTLAFMGRPIEPDMTTRELDQIGRAVMEPAGASPPPKSFDGFPVATCISMNEEIVHGIPGTGKISRGDLVNIDTPLSR